MNLNEEGDNMSEQVKEIAARVKVLREIEDISAETLAEELGFNIDEYLDCVSVSTDGSFPSTILVSDFRSS